MAHALEDNHQNISSMLSAHSKWGTMSILFIGSVLPSYLLHYLSTVCRNRELE